MHVKVASLRQILREARRVAPDRQPVVLRLFHAAVQAALRDDLPGVGETVRLRVYVPHVDEADRESRRQRIQQALAAGEPTRQIARREQVSERWVRALRARGGSAVP